MSYEEAKRAIIDKVDEVAGRLTSTEYSEMMNELADDFRIRAESIEEEQ